MTYSAQSGDLFVTMAICGALLLILVWLGIYMSKSKDPDPRKRILAPMLSYFLAMLALMGLLGSAWSYTKFPDLTLDEGHIYINNEKHAWPGNHDIRVETFSGNGLGGGGSVLLIKTDDQKTWAFPSDRYPVNEILSKLKRQ